MKTSSTFTHTLGLLLVLQAIFHPLNAKTRKVSSDDSSTTNDSEMWGNGPGRCVGEECILVKYKDAYETTADESDSVSLETADLDMIDDDLMLVDIDSLDESFFVHKGTRRLLNNSRLHPRRPRSVPGQALLPVVLVMSGASGLHGPDALHHVSIGEVRLGF